MGHDVRLIPSSYVKPYMKRGKTDAADAAAICEHVTAYGRMSQAVLIIPLDLKSREPLRHAGAHVQNTSYEDKMKELAGVAAGIMLLAAQAGAAEPSQGDGKTARGNTARIVKCGSGFCIALQTGKHAVRQLGSLSMVGRRIYRQAHRSG